MNPYYSDDYGTLYNGDSKEVLDKLEPNSVDMIITSPPYWALRDYHADGQLGQEPLFLAYISNLVDYFCDASNVLKHNGTLWVNLGDTYYSKSKGTGGPSKKQLSNKGSRYNQLKIEGGELPEKSLCLIPNRFAIAMQNVGFILRNDIIWHKPNQMPTSAKDRFTLDYEHLFFFTLQNKKYYFEQQLEPYTAPMNRWGGEKLKADGESIWDNGTGQSSYRIRNMRPNKKGRNFRSVWSINTQPIKGMNHFAKFPEKLIETPIKAGCPEGGVVLDIFFGSGTTGVVCERLNRKWMGIELNKNYCDEALERIINARTN